MSKILSVGKCKGCKILWKEDQLKKIEFLETVGDGVIRRKAFLCLDCYNNLDSGLKEKKTELEKGK